MIIIYLADGGPVGAVTPTLARGVSSLLNAHAARSSRSLAERRSPPALGRLSKLSADGRPALSDAAALASQTVGRGAGMLRTADK